MNTLYLRPTISNKFSENRVNNDTEFTRREIGSMGGSGLLVNIGKIECWIYNEGVLP